MSLRCLWPWTSAERDLFHRIQPEFHLKKKNHLSITKTQMVRFKWEMNDHSKIFLGKCTALVCLRRCHILVILQQLLKKFIKIEWRIMRKIFSIRITENFSLNLTVSVAVSHPKVQNKVIKEIKGAESRHSSAHNRYVEVPSTSNCEWESLVWSIVSIWEIRT